MMMFGNIFIIHENNFCDDKSISNSLVSQTFFFKKANFDLKMTWRHVYLVS